MQVNLTPWKRQPSIPWECQREGKEKTQNPEGFYKSPLETEKEW